MMNFHVWFDTLYLCQCFTSQSTIFQSCWDLFQSSWVEPVLKVTHGTITVACYYSRQEKRSALKWTSMLQNLSSGFPIKRDSKQSPQLQRLARKFICCKFRFNIFQKANNQKTKELIRLGGCAGFCCSQTLKAGFLESRPK